MHTCAHCGATSSEAANYCPNCGRPLALDGPDASRFTQIIRPAAGRVVESSRFAIHAPAGSFAEEHAPEIGAELERLATALAGLLNISDDALDRTRVYLEELLTEPSHPDPAGVTEAWIDFDRGAIHAVYRPDAPGVDLRRAAVRLLIRRAIGTDLGRLPAVCAGLATLCSERSGDTQPGSAARALLEQTDHGQPSLAGVWGASGQSTADAVAALAAASFLGYLFSGWDASGLRGFIEALGAGDEREAARAAFRTPLSRLERDWRKVLPKVGRSHAGGIGRFLASSFYYLRPHWRQQLVILLCLAVQLAFQQILPRAQALLIDKAIVPRDLHYLASLAVFLLGLVALVLLAGVLNDLVRTRVSEAVLRRLRERMFGQLQVLSHRFYSQMESGDIISRFTSDLRSVEQALTSTLASGLFLMLSLVLSTIHILLINWTLAVFVLVSLPLFFLSTRLLGPPAQRASQEYSERQAAVTSVLQEDLAAQPVIKAFNLQTTMMERFSEQARALYHSAVRLFFLSSLFGVTANLLTALVQVAILGLGGFFVIEGRMPLGNLFEFLALLGLVIGPVQSISGILQSIQVATASMDRVEEILNAVPDVRDLPDAKETGPLREGIGLEGVSFSYRGDQPQLADITIDIPAGTSAAFIGPSGSGKSTLISLLSRFYDPDRGRILFDGIDARNLTLASLRQQIGVVAQESYLFNTSIRENIRLGREEASDADVEEAARLAEIHEAIQQLPQGYDTVVGERGGNLSGGQRQRLAIARAIIRRPSVLILDEATSALDPRTENAINHTLASLSRGRTTLSVTHRLATGAAADRIFVLDHGRVVESGSHDELLEANGLYRRLYEEQGGLTGDGGVRALAVSYLRGVPAFGDLPPETLATLAQSLRHERVVAGRDVIQVGEAGDRLYLIISGEVEVLSPHPADGGRVLARLGPGGYFGEIALLRDVPRTATVRARTDADLFSMDRESLGSVLEAVPGLLSQLEAAVDARLSDTGSSAGAQQSGDGRGAETAAVLELRDGAGAPRLIRLDESETTIGRNSGNDIVLDDHLVSRFHARIRRRPDGTYELRDSESTNGTALDGHRIQEPMPLHEGDVLQIGKASLTFHAKPPDPD